MKIATFHNRLERREYTFTRADVMKALQEVVKQWSTAPAVAATVDWDIQFRTGDEWGDVTDVVLSQNFEYLSTAVDEPVSGFRGTESTGQPDMSTRDKESSDV